MNNKLLVSNKINLKQALRAVNDGGEKSLIIVDEKNTLLGTLSDGDLRRAILSGTQLNQSVDEIYNSSPTYFYKNKYTKDEAKKTFLKEKFDIIPVVNSNKKVVKILLLDDIFEKNKSTNSNQLNLPIVIMAGGRGTRLEPFTKVLPKPLIPLNDKTIIEHIINKFTVIGVKDVFITVNYKSRILKAFFEELNPNYKVSFIEEHKPLGTAGSLQYLKGKINCPFFISNCDIIIDIDYKDLYSFHQMGGYDLTLVASAKEYIIPYGTCQLNSEGSLSNINEKPEYNFLVNTGLYIMDPKILKTIPENKFYHITDLIGDIIGKSKKVGVYPVSDDAWIDIGQWDEYKKIYNQIT